MANPATGSVVRQLGALFEGGSMAGLSDRELLDRFAIDRDEHAFAALVARHGPMVLNVCREILGDRQHAEDAFQAVFLVLARRAGSIGDPDRLGNWLYGVAVRTARCARQQIERRRRQESDASQHPDPGTAPPADRPAIEREQVEALHVEIGRLPRDFRSAVVLCYFEGLTLDEAARRLRCPAGTLRSRLARARDRLRIALTRRGITPAVILGDRLTPASFSPLLCESTTRAAIAFVARHADGGALSAPAAAMAREVLRSMFFHKFGLTAIAVVLLGMLTGGVVLGRGSSDPVQTTGRGSSAAVPAVVETRPDAERTTVVGRVLDPSGRPVPGAAVMVILQWKLSREPMFNGGPRPTTHHDGRCDVSGRFRIDVPRLTTARHDEARVVATAPGFAIGWAGLDLDADAPDVDVSLHPEQVIRGRLLDLHGRPAKGVRMEVYGITRPADGEGLTWAVVRPDAEAFPRQDLTAWPGPAVSDDRGQFVLSGLGRGLEVLVHPDDPRFDRSLVLIRTVDTGRPARVAIPVLQVDPDPDAPPVAIAMLPARTLSGLVTYGDTGRPVPHARIAISGFRHRADADGRFRIGIEAATGPRAGVSVAAQSPEGAPYLLRLKELAWPRGAVEQTIDLALQRGILIRGKVTEEGTGRPVAGAVVSFAPDQLAYGEVMDVGIPAATGPDGTYRAAAPPGPGYLVVEAPSDEYVLRECGAVGLMTTARPGRQRLYAHAYRALDLKTDVAEVEADLTLRPGATVRGRVVGPDDRPIRDASIYCRTVLRSMPSGGWRSWIAYGIVQRAPVRDGHFALHGLDPDAEVPAYFLDRERRLGATVRLSGRSASDGPVTVRLEPCGAARMRFVGGDGRPRVGVNYVVGMTMVVTPGPSARDNPTGPGPLLADEAPLYRLDDPWPGRVDMLQSDAEGRLTIPALIPSATYRITDQSPAAKGGDPPIRKEFTVEPGETLDLGEILMEGPS